MMTLRSWKGSTGRTWHLTLPFMGQMLMERYMTLWVFTACFWPLLWLFITIDLLTWSKPINRAVYLGFTSVLCSVLCFFRKSKSGTFAIWTPFWILLNVKVASPLRVSIHRTCILACGRLRLHGTLRTWTSTVSITCTLESPNHGKDTESTAFIWEHYDT